MKTKIARLKATIILLALTAIQNHAQSIYEPYTFTTLAGVSPCSVDGTGSFARFNDPQGVAVDTAGNVYVADTDSHVIRKVTPAGVVTTLAGLVCSAGSADGTGSAARFYSPRAVAVDSAGNVYVADAGNSTIRKVAPTGAVTTVAGLAGFQGSADGTGPAAQFRRPEGVAVDTSGNVYVADTGNNTIRKVTPAGVVTTLAGLAQLDTNGDSVGGSADGTGNAARFGLPGGVAVDTSGNVYIADIGNSTIRKVTPARVVTTLAGLAGGNSVAVDGLGNLYVRKMFDEQILRMTPGGVVTTTPGWAGGYFSIAVDSSGNLYWTYKNGVFTKTSSGELTTLAGLGYYGGWADGTGSAAGFSSPEGVATDGAGNVYVAEWSAIRKVTPTGVVTTLAGAEGMGSTDGTGPAAQFTKPHAVTVDTAGNVYVADTGNNTIRKVTPAGEVTTLAGLAQCCVQGSVDGVGPAAQFRRPEGVAVDTSGNVYVADTGNNTIRKVTPAGMVTTLAGLAQLDANGNSVSGSADGTGNAARFALPGGVALDNAGNVYVADTGNNTIRKVTAAGVVTTLAGLAGNQGSADGTGSTARFAAPQAVAVDSFGNVYVADTGNNTIRKVTSAGMVVTLGGLTALYANNGHSLVTGGGWQHRRDRERRGV